MGDVFSHLMVSWCSRFRVSLTVTYKEFLLVITSSDKMLSFSGLVELQVRNCSRKLPRTSVFFYN